MSDRWLRMFTVKQLFKYSMIQVPTVIVCSGFFVVGALLTRVAIWRNRHVENDAFKRYKYKYVVVRPDNPYIKWFHQRDDKELMADFEADSAPYPNKYNDFRSFPASGTPYYEKPAQDNGILVNLGFVSKAPAKVL